MNGDLRVKEPVSEAVIEVRHAGVGGVRMLSRTEGTGVGGCGACVACAPWSVALPGKLCSDIVTKDLVNVRVNQMKIDYFAAPKVEVLWAKQLIERTTELHRKLI